MLNIVCCTDGDNSISMKEEATTPLNRVDHTLGKCNYMCIAMGTFIVWARYMYVYLHVLTVNTAVGGCVCVCVCVHLVM